MTRWLAALPLIVLLGLGGLFYFYALHRNPQVQPMALVGKPMPDVTLPSLDDGQPVRLREALANGPVVVNFWASWCGPCRLDQPALLALEAKGVRIVGVDYEDVPPRGSRAEAKAFLSQLGDPFAVRVADDNGRAGVEFGITGVPETYVVSPSGQVLLKRTGPLTEADAAELAKYAR
jgi:cytochrome c biogenesis protein CcmG/thiol:disulfide interchange protein DsbE